MLHPFLTHFPIVLVILLSLFELLSIWYQSLQTAKELILVVLAISVVGAFFSGYFAADVASQSFQVSADVIAYHQLWAKCGLFLSVPLLILGFFHHRAVYYKRFFSGCYYILLILTAIVIAYTSYLGGDLVFAHGAGVRVSTDVETSEDR